MKHIGMAATGFALAAAALVAAGAGTRGVAPPASGHTLRLVKTIDLPGPAGKRFDYLIVDPGNHLLFSSHLGAGVINVIDTRTVDTHMRRLREKLGPAAKHLDTVRGVGYRLVITT